ncbi:MAG: hypothetical protein G01um101444_189 [Parcubacteria group bacterium Gr01-1014_44]|nr:MAG: hypothetical protein G01um101444_189 [Parcubacteria group bacterium Gr01-1014_44]
MPGLSKNIKKAVISLVKPLSDRNRDVIMRRFGLKTGQPETLESIGQSYGITRERVRQIEEYAIKNLRVSGLETAAVLTRPYFDFAVGLLKENNGFVPEKDLFKKFSGQTSENNADNLSLTFLLFLHPDFNKNHENDDLYSFWFLSKDYSDLPKNLVNQTVAILNNQKKLVDQAGLYAIYKSEAEPKSVSMDTFLAVLSISKKIDRNVFGEYGLADWPEIRPRGVRDRAYLVLKKESKPKHFREIASLINTANFSHKKANIQTVHNELIKDIRFVLVGRGIYGLAEWGYKAGTVKDVLVAILKESRRSLSKQDLVGKVLAARYVKENTILLNLQDSKVFRKKDDGTYSLKEA